LSFNIWIKGNYFKLFKISLSSTFIFLIKFPIFPAFANLNPYPAALLCAPIHSILLLLIAHSNLLLANPTATSFGPCLLFQFSPAALGSVNFGDSSIKNWEEWSNFAGRRCFCWLAAFLWMFSLFQSGGRGFGRRWLHLFLRHFSYLIRKLKE